MKYKLLFWTLVAISFGMDSFSDRTSQAQPAPIFEPIIEEIRSQLPSDFQMRLPASLPSFTEDLELYAFIPDDDVDVVTIGEGDYPPGTLSPADLLRKRDRDVFTVLVSETSDCATEDNPLDCTVGIVGVTETTSESDIQADDLPSDSIDITPIELKEEVKGFYFVQDEDYQLVVWKQDELAYLLITDKCSDDCVSKPELIKMAKSAAHEPAITNSDSAKVDS